MTVERLMEILEEQPEDAIVYIGSSDDAHELVAVQCLATYLENMKDGGNDAVILASRPKGENLNDKAAKNQSPANATQDESSEVLGCGCTVVKGWRCPMHSCP